MDLLADILRALRLKGTVYFQADFNAPWGMAFAQSEVANFHYVVAGHCWAEHGDGPTRLDPGDVIVFPHGDRHRLLSGEDVSALPAKELIDTTERKDGGRLVYGGHGEPTTTLICGHFTYDRALIHPVWRGLPGVLCLRAGDAGAEWGACAAEVDTTIEGTTKPLAAMSFKNAFDPTDTKTYDPDDPASLPAPVMVDAWGERGSGAHGTLGVFPPGFSAPLHTHTDAYDGVVLRGKMTNPFGKDLSVFLGADDANNHGATVLGPGSYWHVPADAQHTTTCVGPEVCWFYFHAEKGFDFTPFVDDKGALVAGITLEDAHSEAVLLQNDELQFAEAAPFVSFAPAWGDMSAGAHGSFGDFKEGAASPVHVHGAEYYGVVISGELSNPFNHDASPKALTRGGFWSVPAESVHVTACASGAPCQFYFHQRTGFDFTPLCDQSAR